MSFSDDLGSEVRAVVSYLNKFLSDQVYYNTQKANRYQFTPKTKELSDICQEFFKFMVRIEMSHCIQFLYPGEHLTSQKFSSLITSKGFIVVQNSDRFSIDVDGVEKVFKPQEVYNYLSNRQPKITNALGSPLLVLRERLIGQNSQTMEVVEQLAQSTVDQQLVATKQSVSSLEDPTPRIPRLYICKQTQTSASDAASAHQIEQFSCGGVLVKVNAGDFEYEAVNCCGRGLRLTCHLNFPTLVLAAIVLLVAAITAAQMGNLNNRITSQVFDLDFLQINQKLVVGGSIDLRDVSNGTTYLNAVRFQNAVVLEGVEFQNAAYLQDFFFNNLELDQLTANNASVNVAQIEQIDVNNAQINQLSSNQFNFENLSATNLLTNQITVSGTATLNKAVGAVQKLSADQVTVTDVVAANANVQKVTSANVDVKSGVFADLNVTETATVKKLVVKGENATSV